MLNDHERETLRDIQRQLFVDDPDFERSFRALKAPPQTHARMVYTAGIVIAALLAIVGVLAGSPGGALAFTVLAGLVWWARHHHDSASQRKRGG